MGATAVKKWWSLSSAYGRRTRSHECPNTPEPTSVPSVLKQLLCARVNRRTCVLGSTTRAAHTSPHVEEGARPLTSSPPFSDNMVSLCATSPWIAQSPYSGGMKQLFAETLQERITNAHNQTPPSTCQNQDQNGPPGPHHLREQVTYPLVPKRCREIRMMRACDGASLAFAWPFVRRRARTPVTSWIRLIVTC